MNAKNEALGDSLKDEPWAVLYCAPQDLSRSDQKWSDLIRFQLVLLRSDQNLSSSEQF